MGYDEDAEEDAIEEEEDDSYLHEFREPSVYRQSAEASGTILHPYDRSGSFRIDQTALEEEVQELLYAFRRFNLRRVKRRRERVELGTLESERATEAERRAACFWR